MTAAEYRQFDATGLAQLVKNKSVHPSELVELAIEQASIHNPKLNAIVFPLYELAKEMAQQVDLDSPFAGVPILLKDLGVHLKGYPMSNGSRGWDKNIPDQDDYFVQQMRRAGFLFLGKTNTPELGLAPYTEPELFGPTRNPLDTTRTAGGSSGGSGAAVAAGIVPIATASDGGGSIRIPASCNGLFGLKPSRGRISLGPQIGQSWSGAVVQGCVSRSVRDTAAFLDATAGFFPGDPYALPTPPKSFTKAIEEAPTTYRIGFSTQHTLGHQLAPSCIQAVEQVAKQLEDLGHQVEEVHLPYYAEDLSETFLYIILADTAASVSKIEAHLGRKVRAGKEVEATTYLQALIGNTFSAQEYILYRKKWNDIARRMATFHQQYDFLLTATAAQPPFKIGALQPTPAEMRQVHFINSLKLGKLARKRIHELADKIFDYIPYTPLANMTGQPSMSVPLHRTAEGLPVGLLFTAAMGEEAQCLCLARQLEEGGGLGV